MNTCKVCVVDDSFPNFKLDEKGICNYCKLHNEMENEIPNDERGSKILLKKVENILKKNSVHFDLLGETTDKEIIINDGPTFTVDKVTEFYRSWLYKYMS